MLNLTLFIGMSYFISFRYFFYSINAFQDINIIHRFSFISSNGFYCFGEIKQYLAPANLCNFVFDWCSENCFTSINELLLTIQTIFQQFFKEWISICQRSLHIQQFINIWVLNLGKIYTLASDFDFLSFMYVLGSFSFWDIQNWVQSSFLKLQWYVSGKNRGSLGCQTNLHCQVSKTK